MFGGRPFQVNGVAKCAKGWRPLFIVPGGNLSVEVTENQTCSVEHRTSLRNSFRIQFRAPDKFGAQGLSC
jgi:hypothetical protein